MSPFFVLQKLEIGLFGSGKTACFQILVLSFKTEIRWLPSTQTNPLLLLWVLALF